MLNVPGIPGPTWKFHGNLYPRALLLMTTSRMAQGDKTRWLRITSTGVEDGFHSCHWLCACVTPAWSSLSNQLFQSLTTAHLYCAWLRTRSKPSVSTSKRRNHAASRTRHGNWLLNGTAPIYHALWYSSLEFAPLSLVCSQTFCFFFGGHRASIQR